MTGDQGTRGRVSVVTPVYNGAAYVGRLLESVLAQTWPQVEMILSDDGSQDRTVETARSFQERFEARGYSLQIVTGPHKNASAAINRALPMVTGEFLVWPDSDDALDPESLRRRAEFLRANPRYQCVRSLARYRNEDGSPAPRQEVMERGDGEELFFPVLWGRSFVCCGCYMLRCGAFFSIYPQRRIPEYDVGQNFQMLLPVLYAHRCPTLQEALYTVYVRPDSHSRRVLTQGEEEAKYAAFEALVDEIAGICRVSGLEERLQIECWKRRRRYALRKRWRRKREAAAELWWLLRHGSMGAGSAVKEAAELLGGPRLRRLWRRLRSWSGGLFGRRGKGGGR